MFHLDDGEEQLGPDWLYDRPVMWLMVTGLVVGGVTLWDLWATLADRWGPTPVALADIRGYAMPEVEFVELRDVQLVHAMAIAVDVPHRGGRSTKRWWFVPVVDGARDLPAEWTNQPLDEPPTLPEAHLFLRLPERPARGDNERRAHLVGHLKRGVLPGANGISRRFPSTNLQTAAALRPCAEHQPRSPALMSLLGAGLIGLGIWRARVVRRRSRRDIASSRP